MVRIPKRLLFTMKANSDFLGTISTNPYKFQHFGIRRFVMYANGRQVRREGLAIDPGHEEATVTVYKALFEGSGIHHQPPISRKE